MNRAFFSLALLFLFVSVGGAESVLALDAEGDASGSGAGLLKPFPSGPGPGVLPVGILIGVDEINVGGNVGTTLSDYGELYFAGPLILAYPDDGRTTMVPEPATVVGSLTLGLGGLIGRSRIFSHR